MIWKVYAQNVIRPKGMAIIGMNSDEELVEELEIAVMDFLDTFDYSSFKDSEGDFSDETFDDIHNAVFELFEEHWNKYKYLDMGDYMLIEKDEMPDRPNKCGCSTSLFSVEDVRNHLNNKETKEEKPYIIETITIQKKKYNPNYGDNRICICGHTYYRHFDSWNDMEAVGCKYCGCEEFIEAESEVRE